MKTTYYNFPDCDEATIFDGYTIRCRLRKGHSGEHIGDVQWKKKTGWNICPKCNSELFHLGGGKFAVHECIKMSNE